MLLTRRRSREQEPREEAFSYSLPLLVPLRQRKQALHTEHRENRTSTNNAAALFVGALIRHVARDMCKPSKMQRPEFGKPGTDSLPIRCKTDHVLPIQEREDTCVVSRHRPMAESQFGSGFLTNNGKKIQAAPSLEFVQKFY